MAINNNNSRSMKIQKTIVIRKKMQIKLNKRLYNKKNQYRNNQ